MDVFADPKTRLAFPTKIGPWTRENVTTYPLSSAGYSVIYELRGWLGGRKVLISVDVYDKGLPDIPPGPYSAHVAIELHNCIHAMFANVPPVDASRIDSYLAQPELAAKSLIGQVDPTGHFRSAGGELAVGEKHFHFFVHMLGHRGHFVKFQESDLTNGASSGRVAEILGHFLGQIIVGN
jgi:hypothetical protein